MFPVHLRVYFFYKNASPSAFGTFNPSSLPFSYCAFLLSVTNCTPNNVIHARRVVDPFFLDHQDPRRKYFNSVRKGSPLGCSYPFKILSCSNKIFPSWSTIQKFASSPRAPSPGSPKLVVILAIAASILMAPFTTIVTTVPPIVIVSTGAIPLGTETRLCLFPELILVRLETTMQLSS